MQNVFYDLKVYGYGIKYTVAQCVRAAQPERKYTAMLTSCQH